MDDSEASRFGFPQFGTVSRVLQHVFVGPPPLHVARPLGPRPQHVARVLGSLALDLFGSFLVGSMAFGSDRARRLPAAVLAASGESRVFADGRQGVVDGRVAAPRLVLVRFVRQLISRRVLIRGALVRILIVPLRVVGLVVRQGMLLRRPAPPTKRPRIRRRRPLVVQSQGALLPPPPALQKRLCAGMRLGIPRRALLGLVAAKALLARRDAALAALAAELLRR
mmetsp:Transcript_20772/g.71697  ORF Transcript_20772/g.71697 Transcript_20772/m.71697 type:complete len:224 (-) Transcript_20772:1759-2430(-)